MTRKFFVGLLVVLTLIGLVWTGRFIFSNFRGSGPALKPALSLPQPTGESSSANTTGLPLTVPAEFAISVFANNLENPRVLAWSPQGDLLVSIPSQGRVVALKDEDSDGVSDTTSSITSGLNRPHGLAFQNGTLYIAETDGVSMYDYNGTATNKKKIIDLPSGGNHFSRTIGFGPDGKLYIAIGSSCNVCVEKDQRRASIQVYDGELKPFATGLRNSVFFTWRNGKMWATDMGRDLIGDNIPPEEINIVEEGKNYGWPYCYGNRVHDDNFDPKKSKSCESTIPPHITFQAHSAPLGLAFIPDSWPQEYRGDLLVAYHGSWNRSQPTGYKVVRFDLDEEGRSKGESDFLSGFLTGADALGRPVDLLFDTEGNLFVSDDKAGVIYRVSRR